MKKIFKNYWYLIIIILCILGIYFISNYEEEREVILEENKSFEQVNLKEEKQEDLCEKNTYYIDIKGEVKKPGVYEIDSDKRVIDVINMAGGLTKDADTSLLNLSRKLKDEMNIIIYSKVEIENAKKSITTEPQVIEVIKEVEKIVEVEKECLCEKNDICIDSNNEVVINEEINDVNSDNTENIDKEVKDNVSHNDICNENEKKENNKLVNINTASKEELMNVKGIGESKAIKIIEYRENNKFEKIEDIMNVSGIGNAMFEKIKEYITV